MGERVIKSYVATGPDDDDATVNTVLSLGNQKYCLSRDLAILELKHPLRHYHGVPFTLDDLRPGQTIVIYAFPKEAVNPLRSLLRFQGSFIGETTTGLLAFHYDVTSGRKIRGGASGGLVVDSKTDRVVGILNGIDMEGKPIVTAVPIQSLADFVERIQPSLSQSIFYSTDSGVSPLSADLFPKYVPTPQTSTLERREEEPEDVKMLRNRARRLVNGMRDFVAVQSMAWGSAKEAPAAVATYEVQVVDGQQQFREYPDGKKLLRELPHPRLNAWVGVNTDWATMPQLVGTEYGLKIHPAGEVLVEGHRVKIFQFWGSKEDRACPFESLDDFVFFSVRKFYFADCYGEVWTDDDFNILRMSEHDEIPDTWQDYQTVVTYGWLRRIRETPRLIPVSVFTQSKLKGKLHWCRSEFTNYQVFSSRVKMAAN